jgi:tetratricopeptide (TPR) repeat protein
MKKVVQKNKICAAVMAALFFLSACNANSPENRFLFAEKLLEDRKYDAAINEFQEIVDKAPNSVLGLDSQLKIAQIEHLYLGRSKEAMDAYREFLKRNKDEKKKREIEKILADLLFQNFENYDDAIVSYEKLIEKNPGASDSEEILFRIGRALFLRSKFDEAMRAFTQQKNRFPNGEYFWRAELEIANSFSALSKCVEAIKQFDKIIASGPKDISVLASFGKAICLEEQDNLDLAYEILSGIKNAYPAPSVIELKLQKIKRRKILRKR